MARQHEVDPVILAMTSVWGRFGGGLAWLGVGVRLEIRPVEQGVADDVSGWDLWFSDDSFG